MDLGFVFFEEDKDSILVEIILGLQRLGGKMDGKGQEEAGNVNNLQFQGLIFRKRGKWKEGLQFGNKLYNRALRGRCQDELNCLLPPLALLLPPPSQFINQAFDHGLAVPDGDMVEKASKLCIVARGGIKRLIRPSDSQSQDLNHRKLNLVDCSVGGQTAGIAQGQLAMHKLIRW
ncbi:unnamed protein product [Fraxinus pennsylvanica]|uniref:Uncharacterized protein n=1 Tax=Fraxinus pennsylvanica TaxID=56036 RepID=A0AAD2E7V1_9LAMI|nr:unnamed protein product [Fraxinus pennsylvanica]